MSPYLFASGLTARGCLILFQKQCLSAALIGHSANAEKVFRYLDAKTFSVVIAT